MVSLENYYNKVTNDGRIFSFEDVVNIPREEDAFYRKAIDYQYGEIGFPRDEELMNSRDVVYVRAYTRDDGIPVRAHYRSKNGHNYTNPNKPVLGTPKETKAKIDAMVDKWMDSWKEPETKTLKGGIDYDNKTDDYSKIEEIKGIKEKNAQEREEIERERILGYLKDYGGAALEIGSAFVPGVGVGKIGAALIKKLTPVYGRQLATQLVKGMIAEGTSGAVFGAGEGLRNDENIFLSSTKGAALGGVTGGLIGGAAGKVAQDVRKTDINNVLQKREDWGIAYRNESGKPEQAIERLLKEKKGFVPNAIKEHGGIDFVWGKYTKPVKKGKKGGGGGLAHIIGRRNEDGYNGLEFVKQLPKLLRKGKKYNKKNHSGRFYIGDDNQEAVIRTDYSGKPWRWLNSAYFFYK